VSHVRTARQRAESAFRRIFGNQPEAVARAPGRVNLIGEHVDYNDGLVVPVAIELDVVVCARARADGVLVVHADDLGQTSTLEIDADDASGWAAYVVGVAALLQAAGVLVPGADIAFAGDIPLGAGLSSSAALEAAMALALLRLGNAEMEPLHIAQLCREAESRWAGVSCGIMDQFAALLSRADHAMLLDCRSLETRFIPWPPSVAIVVIDSGVSRQLAASAYNERVRECAAAAQQLGVPALRDADTALLAASDHLPETLFRRARHVITEIGRTRSFGASLQAGELQRCGELLHQSHASLRDDYEVSSPQLDTLVAITQSIPGVLGSRLTGAGFGGCTVTLVQIDALDECLTQVPSRYRKETGLEARVFVTRPSDSAALVDV
jgi:galactokinase